VRRGTIILLSERNPAHRETTYVKNGPTTVEDQSEILITAEPLTDPRCVFGVRWPVARSICCSFKLPVESETAVAG
jgi:hypothetical protein